MYQWRPPLKGKTKAWGAFHVTPPPTANAILERNRWVYRKDGCCHLISYQGKQPEMHISKTNVGSELLRGGTLVPGRGQFSFVQDHLVLFRTCSIPSSYPWKQLWSPSAFSTITTSSQTPISKCPLVVLVPLWVRNHWQKTAHHSKGESGSKYTDREKSSQYTKWGKVTVDG